MKIALNLEKLTEAETVLLGTTVHDKLVGNTRVTPSPTVAELKTLRDNAQAGIDGVAAAERALALAITIKNNGLNALRAGLTEEADTVEDAVKDLSDAEARVVIESTGMTPQSAPTRLTSLGPITDLSLTAGDVPGRMDWHCDPVDRARFYVPEWTTDPIGPTANWRPGPMTTTSKGEIPGVPNGAAVSIRVHAQGTRNIVGAPATAGPKTAP